MVKKWMGKPPEKCDICRRKFGTVFYDARTRSGAWGCLCFHCFQRHGVGLGTGCGQKYDVKTLEKLEG